MSDVVTTTGWGCDYADRGDCEGTVSVYGGAAVVVLCDKHLQTEYRDKGREVPMS